ncbi:histidine phosphatase family protein [uncultured Sphingomonas sp.]|uniref:SixA phosphatase family protein n=1 Tax=uncultured Sphingomonas sp. TaxID=158754 RepID=UPI0035CA5664
MKTLTLLRHAKSGWDDQGVRDFDRRLNPKGKRAARLMGRHMRDSGVAWDHAIASPAARVVETLNEVAEGYGRAIEPVWDRRVYLASAATLLDLVQSTADDHGGLLLSGHNPGLEDLILTLVADIPDNPLRDAVEAKFPTCSMAVTTAEVDRWADFTPRAITLTKFVRPRDLDPGLGPDAD